MAYLAAVMAHPAFTARFPARSRPARLARSRDRGCQAVRRSRRARREVVWLHTYGERFADPPPDRPKQAPRLPKEQARRPFRPTARSRPRPSRCPTRWTTTPAKRRLKIGKGYVENVTPEMWAYEVSGKQVLWQWFSYRRRDREPPHHRRPPSAVAARRNPARPLAAGIHDRPAGPAERPGPADSAGAGAGRPAGPHLRGRCSAADELVKRARSRRDATGKERCGD